MLLYCEIGDETLNIEESRSSSIAEMEAVILAIFAGLIFIKQAISFKPAGIYGSHRFRSAYV